MKRQMLSLSLTLLILLSAGGIISVVGAASHATPVQISKPTVRAASCAFIGCKCSNTYHYPGCYWAQIIKHENIVCFNSPCDAEAAGYRPCDYCKPPVC